VIPQFTVEAAEPQELIYRIREHANSLSPIPTKLRPQLRPLPDIRALLFDVYGTLFISASGDIFASSEVFASSAVPASSEVPANGAVPASSEVPANGDTENTSGNTRSHAFNRSLVALGQPLAETAGDRASAALVESIRHTHERLKRRGIDYPEVDIREELFKVLDSLRRDGLLSAKPSREFCETLSVDYECRVNPTWPMPGMLEMLQSLRDREILLGIVSNAQFFTPLLFPALVDASLETLGFESELCIWSYRHREAKPSTGLFIFAVEALQKRNIDPHQILYVGNDRINDIWPASQLGLKTALFAGDRRSYRPRVEDPRARNVREDIVLTDLSQLPDLLVST
jgi:putative hydrolase of the HAD superfamily